jgi:hypothetical protein
MAAAVARQESDLAAFEFAEDKSVGGRAKGRFDALLVDVGESGHGVKPAAADDADFYLRHLPLLVQLSAFSLQPSAFSSSGQ